MKEIEFYQRAATDAAFRHAKLEELRYFKHVGAGLTWFCVILGTAFSVYSGLTAGDWDKGVGLVMVAALCASTRAMCAARMAALQALNAPRAESLSSAR